MPPFRGRRTKSDFVEKCDALYIWHKDIIYRMALAAVGGDKKWALSILENCMLIAYDNIDKFDNEKSERSKSIMVAILQNLINSIYMEVWDKMGLHDDFLGTSASPRDRFDVDQILIRNELTADLAKYVEHLTNSDKEIIFLRFFMGLSMEEISEQFGISQKEVEKKIFIVKQKIARMIKEG